MPELYTCAARATVQCKQARRQQDEAGHFSAAFVVAGDTSTESR
jgi:hypothetical protein